MERYFIKADDNGLNVCGVDYSGGADGLGAPEDCCVLVGAWDLEDAVASLNHMGESNFVILNADKFKDYTNPREGREIYVPTYACDIANNKESALISLYKRRIAEYMARSFPDYIEDKIGYAIDYINNSGFNEFMSALDWWTLRQDITVEIIGKEIHVKVFDDDELFSNDDAEPVEVFVL